MTIKVQSSYPLSALLLKTVLVFLLSGKFVLGFQGKYDTDGIGNTTYFSPNVIFSESGFIAGEGFCQCGRPTHRVLTDLQKQAFQSIQNDIPWTATFVTADDYHEIFCTGVLLNNLYILTAGQCVLNVRPKDMKVVLNEDNLLPNYDTIGSLLKYNVSEILIHPKYNHNTQRHDLALIKLSEPIDFFEKLLNPVCIPIQNVEYYKKYNGTITKWGAASDGLDGKTKVVNGSSSDIDDLTAKSQVKLNLPLISNQQCNTETTHKGMISEDMLCAGFLTSTENCKGDSGGPLTVKRVDRHHLVGIASWSNGCSIAYSPSIYTRVGSYIGWILRNTKDAEWCIE